MEIDVLLKKLFKFFCVFICIPLGMLVNYGIISMYIALIFLILNCILY